MSQVLQPQQASAPKKKTVVLITSAQYNAARDLCGQFLRLPDHLVLASLPPGHATVPKLSAFPRGLDSSLYLTNIETFEPTAIKTVMYKALGTNHITHIDIVVVGHKPVGDTSALLTASLYSFYSAHKNQVMYPLILYQSLFSFLDLSLGTPKFAILTHERMANVDMVHSLFRGRMPYCMATAALKELVSKMHLENKKLVVFLVACIDTPRMASDALSAGVAESAIPEHVSFGMKRRIEDATREEGGGKTV